MNKIGWLFAGQGAQYIGMGKDFYDNSKVSKEIYDLSEEVSGLPVKKICFEDNEQINQTQYTQIAICTTSLAISSELRDRGYQPDLSAGLSLGEYSALMDNGVFELKDGLYLVKQRGEIMETTVPQGVGGMAAIMGMDIDKIRQLIAPIQGVEVANDNCPGQVVITGYKEAVEKGMVVLKENGARRCQNLSVSGPFHSSLMEPGKLKLSSCIEKISLHSMTNPYISNVDGAVVTDEKEVPKRLATQLASSVLWRQSIETMISLGVDTFIEIGPGKALTAFLKKINPTVKGVNINQWSDLDKFEEFLA